MGVALRLSVRRLVGGTAHRQAQDITPPKVLAARPCLPNAKKLLGNRVPAKRSATQVRFLNGSGSYLSASDACSSGSAQRSGRSVSRCVGCRDASKLSTTWKAGAGGGCERMRHSLKPLNRNHPGKGDNALTAVDESIVNFAGIHDHSSHPT